MGNAPRGTPKNMDEYRQCLAEIDDVDISWFAGWLSADGCITIVGENGRPRVKFLITDRDPLDRFVELFGNSVGGPWTASGLGVKDRWGWDISGWKAILLLERCLPWLSKRYSKRAIDAIAGFEIRGHHGSKLTPSQVGEIKAELATGGWGTTRRLARRYKVSDANISAIKSGRVWSDGLQGER